MPNRIIKDGIHLSDSVNAMTDLQFRIWVNLITYVDDFGRGDARAAVIKGACFPLLPRISCAEIEKTLKRLAELECIQLYEVDGRLYFHFINWEKHQTVRNKRSRYPAPEDGQIMQVESNCMQVESNCARNPIQSNPNTNTNPNTNPNTILREAQFEEFWQAYPKKKSKGDARKAFMKVKVPLNVLLDAIETQKQSRQWREQGGKFIPYPATWLNREGWDDVQEIVTGVDEQTDNVFVKLAMEARANDVR